MTDAPRALEIRFQSFEVECSLCGRHTEMGWGVPTYNGDLVSNEFPDDLHRRGGGSIPVCRDCYDRHAAGKIETFDRCYLRHREGFRDGAGI